MMIAVMTSSPSSSSVETADLSPFLRAMFDLAEARLVYQRWRTSPAERVAIKPPLTPCWLSARASCPSPSATSSASSKTNPNPNPAMFNAFLLLGFTASAVALCLLLASRL